MSTLGAEIKMDWTYTPQVAVRVAIRQLHKDFPIDERLSWPRTDACTNLISNGNIFVTRALRDERRAGSVECVKFVRQNGFESITNRLMKISK